MATKRGRSPSPQQIPSIFLSSTIDHQTSSFTAVFSPSLSAKSLQALPDFKTASHRIAAWRLPSKQKSLDSKVIYDTGHDDDGESWAGKRLSNVLNDTQVSGAVVVARWYGGQNIGPIRFTHIENCAKEAVWKWKVAEADAKKGDVTKKQKVDEEEKRRELIKNLADRDYSISTLRKLLAEKKARLQDEEVAPPTPQKPQVYETMSLAALTRVDKARDATIAFILKQIDKVDEELKLVEALEDDTAESLKGAEEPNEDDLWKEAEEARREIEDASSTPT